MLVGVALPIIITMSITNSEKAILNETHSVTSTNQIKIWSFSQLQLTKSKI